MEQRTIGAITWSPGPNRTNNLDGKMKLHATIKYSLLPKRIKQKIEKDSQEDKIMDHENTLIEMGYLRPKKKKKGQKVKPSFVKKLKIKDEDENEEISDEDAIEVA